MDQVGRNLFAEIGVFEGYPFDPFAENDVRQGLAHIAEILRLTFESGGGKPGVPLVRIYSNRTGILLRMRGIMLDGDRGKQRVVMLERGESAAHKEARLCARYGLAPRELEILRLLSTNRHAKELAAATGITPGTLKTYYARLESKLGLVGIAELRAFARREVARSFQARFHSSAELRVGTCACWPCRGRQTFFPVSSSSLRYH